MQRAHALGDARPASGGPANASPALSAPGRRGAGGAPPGWRLRPLIVLAPVYLALGSLLRAGLGLRFGAAAGVSPGALLGALAAGVVNDGVVALYLLVPLSLYLALAPGRLYRARLHRPLFFAATAAFVFGLLYLAAVEYFFFEEFDSRLNLVAVDYLLYPHEVLINIRDSYPVLPVVAATAAAALAITAAVWRPLARGMAAAVPARRRAAVFGLHLALAAAAAATFSTRSLAPGGNRVAGEVAINGVSSFFEALRTSEIDYYAFYRSGDPRAMFHLLTRDLGRGGEPFTRLDEGRLDRWFAGRAGEPAPVNVVVVVEESLGADFLGAYGDPRGLSPEFDALARRGVLFTRAYATGTRTVRGLEAIVASFPPIPSVSILHRPGSEGIANWGRVMREHGYHTSFLYGGYSYFDDMRRFFAGNGFEISDRANIDDPAFANIWGVSDEDLFRHAIGWFDRLDRGERPFFSVLLTTSNHKPFTFPPGVPGVPERGGGRDAGVRYADHALGGFIRRAKGRPWFDDTLFVVVGDHGARVYGAAEIPLPSYEVPILLFAPGRLAPARVATPISQIDLAPTVLGLLGLSYQAPFFGQDVLGAPPPAPRTLLFNHNHDVAALRGDRLAVLGLHKSVTGYRWDDAAGTLSPAPPDLELVDLATAYYQTAYDQFEHGTYR